MTTTFEDLELTAVGLPCHLVDPEVFFAEAPAEIEFAKALCTGCPLQAECLAGALERREAAGVWGGQLIANGVVVARKRGRGRPRKNPEPIVARAPEGTDLAAVSRARRAA